MTQPVKIDRQREHQANERTFLAWLRTAVSLIGFGLAIARFGLFLRQLQTTLTQQSSSPPPIFNSENLGIGLIIFGIITLVLAAWRYNQVFWQIERGDYRPSRTLVWITTAFFIILGTLSIPILLGREQASNSPRPAKSTFNSK